jgi:hypothetical protein
VFDPRHTWGPDDFERAWQMSKADNQMTGIPSDPSGIDEPHDVLAA